MPEQFQMRITKVASWPKERTVPLSRGVSIQEAISLKHFKDERALLAAAYGRRGVQQNRLARPLAVANKTVEEIASAIDGYTMGVRTVGTGAGAGPTKKVIVESAANLGADAVNFDAIPRDQHGTFSKLFPKAYASWTARQGSSRESGARRQTEGSKR
jgi:hypothetical protein